MRGYDDGRQDESSCSPSSLGTSSILTTRHQQLVVHLLSSSGVGCWMLQSAQRKSHKSVRNNNQDDIPRGGSAEGKCSATIW